jgi:hypothetical protein
MASGTMIGRAVYYFVAERARLGIINRQQHVPMRIKTALGTHERMAAHVPR